MAKQKNTGKAPEPKVEVDSRELREISVKIGILIEILERIESRLNGGVPEAARSGIREI